MSKPYTSKLGKEYQRPKKTYTDNLTEDDINSLKEAENDLKEGKTKRL